MSNDHRERQTRAAEAIATARLERTPLAPLGEELRPADRTAAYALQEAVHARLAARLGGVAGFKVGCTTPVMQANLGIDSPGAGRVLSRTVHHGTAAFRRGDFVCPGVECEIAVRLGADLAPDGAPFDRASVAAAVDGCMAAIEIVDNRYTDHRAVGAPTLIADDFFAAACVLGEPVSGWRDIDLAAAHATTRVDGVTVGRGQGADVMGHPLNALAWLANAMATRGGMLRRGHFVLTGSIVAVHWVTADETVAVSVDGLGTAQVRFVSAR